MTINTEVQRIRNMDPIDFLSDLASIDEKDLEVYQGMKSLRSHGYSSYRDYTCRETTISTFLSAKMTGCESFSDFQLKLMEIAILFPSDRQWAEFAIGDASKNEGPLSNEKLAYAFDTSVDNVIMKKALEKAITENFVYDGKAYLKKMD